MKKLTIVLTLVSAWLLLGCASTPTPTTEKLTQPASLTRVTSNILKQPTDENLSTTLPRPTTVTPSALPNTTTPLPTVFNTETPTPTPTPYIPPPLPLRDDLEPLELEDFPRPPNDNGLGMHFLAAGYHDEAELDEQIARLKELNLKWATVIYADENQLELAARKFSEAGIFVVWRKTLQPYQRYFAWQRDIDIIKKYNLPPYMQLYNEPELEIEWEGQPVDRDEFMLNLITATKDVYNAGGYPGIQLLDPDWLREFINQVYARKGEAIFKRMFFIPHAYGANHPPEYQEDEIGVLGFRIFATIFFKRLGFVPPFIVGEGGWKIQSHEDSRYPPIDEELHRDYTLAVYDWFRTGELSHGGKLPDYLFAFNMWMLAGQDEAGAWYDSSFGNRTLTIEAVKKIPPFTRKFSWDK